MPLNRFEEMMDNEADVSIFDLFSSLVEMLADFVVHGFGILILLNAVTILAFKCSLYCVKLLWNTLLSLVQVNISTEPWEKDQPMIATEAKKVI